MPAPRITIPGGRPRHQKQLRIPHRNQGFNCGPCGELVALEAKADNEMRPKGDRAAAWISDIRADMTHGSSWPATTLQNIEESIEGHRIQRKMAERDFGSPSASIRHVDVGQVMHLLRGGNCLMVPIMYDRVNHLMPRLSGAPTFNDGHMIVLYGFAVADGWTWTLLYDPLHDGRRDGIPRGIQTVRVRRYLRAAETWGEPQAGKGHAYVIIVN